MHTPGKHKKELLPGSGRYLAVDRLSLLRSKVHKTPLTDAVQLAMAFIGPPQDAIRVFVGSYFGLKAAFGADFVADVAGKGELENDEINAVVVLTLRTEW